MAESGVQSNGWARRMRAQLGSLASWEELPDISCMHPTADLISDSDTPSLPFIPHGRARMLRAPFKSRPSCGDSHAIPS